MDPVKSSATCEVAHTQVKATAGRPACQSSRPHFPGRPPAQMFSISAVGLCGGTRAIRGEFHAITVEQYTQQVSVRPTVALVLLNILTALLTTCPETEKLLLYPKRLAGRCVLLAAPHLLALSCMLSCWMLNLRWITLPHMPPLNRSGLRGVWCATPCVSAHQHPLAVQRAPTPRFPLYNPSACLQEDWSMYCELLQGCCEHTARCVASQLLLIQSPVSVLSSNLLFFWYNPFTGCKTHIPEQYVHTLTATVIYSRCSKALD